MAHDLSIRANGTAEMAYVGDTPWHGLGQSVTKGAGLEVWAKEAGMDWEAHAATPNCSPDSLIKPVCFEGYKGLYRSDTLAPLSIVSSRYQVVQPRDVLEFFRDLTEDHGWHIHTAGVLRGGCKLWAMASNDQHANVSRSKSAKHRDQINQNILLATSLDGSMKTIAKMTAIRVVCANTVALALSGAGDFVQLSHRTAFDATAMKQSLGLTDVAFNAFMEQAEGMSETPIALDEAMDVLRRIFKTAADAQPSSTAWMGKLSDLGNQPTIPEAKESRAVSRVLELFAGAGRGADLATAKGTRWGLFNAVTEHVDHEMGRTADTRLDSAWFGRGNGFKNMALDLLSV